MSLRLRLGVVFVAGVLAAAPATAQESTVSAHRVDPVLEQIVKGLREAAANALKQCPDTEKDGPFDWTEIAQRSLGRHWRDLSPAQRSQFTTVFGCRFAQWYATMISRDRSREADGSSGWIDPSGDWAVLNLGRPESVRPLSYRLHLRESRWLVYDVEVNGRSAIRRFYLEHDPVILDEGYPELVSRLCARIAHPPDQGAGATGHEVRPCRTTWLRGGGVPR